MKKTGNLIVDLTFEFAIDVITFVEILESKKKYVIAKQLLRSGTSIGANVMESQGCESRADFIHKLKVAAKEAEETEYWLSICRYSESYDYDAELYEKLKSIQRVLSKIISNSKKIC